MQVVLNHRAITVVTAMTISVSENGGNDPRIVTVTNLGGEATGSNRRQGAAVDYYNSTTRRQLELVFQAV
jgi:hypothetical protein